MRNIVFGLVETELATLDGWSTDLVVGAAGLVEENLPGPLFAVVRFGVFRPGMGRVQDGSFNVWVHSKGADYEPIDKALQAIYARMDGVEHVSEQDGSAELIRAEWQDTSGDLFDPGFRTITKNSSYRLIGTGA